MSWVVILEFITGLETLRLCIVKTKHNQSPMFNCAKTFNLGLLFSFPFPPTLLYLITIPCCLEDEDVFFTQMYRHDFDFTPTILSFVAAFVVGL